MSFNPRNRRHVHELTTALDISYRELEPFRRFNYRSILQYVGSNYGNELQHYNNVRQRERVPINFVQLAVFTYQNALAAQQPRACVDAMFADRQEMASRLGMALNFTANEINVGQMCKEVVLQAMFAQGCVRTGIEPDNKLGRPIRGHYTNQNQFYAEPVSIDNYVHDTSVERYEQCRFVGDTFYMNYEDFMECGLFKNRKKVKPINKAGLERNTHGELKAREISRYNSLGDHDFNEQVAIRHVWLPFDNLIVYVPDYDSGEQVILRTDDYEGSERGPYHRLNFGEVPDNVMGLCPSTAWIDMHELANQLFLKFSRQSLRQKSVLGVTPGGKDDGMQIKRAKDGEIIMLRDPKNAQEYRFGGPDAQIQGAIMQVQDLFNYMSGNIDAIGGLGQTADTATQSMMIGRGANQRVNQMRQTYVDFKEGDFLDFNVNIDVSSTMPSDPQTKLQILAQSMQQYILPMMPFIQQQGGVLDMQLLTERIAHWTGLKELKDIVKFINPAQQGQQQQGQQTNQPREYIRRNIGSGGGNRAGQDPMQPQQMRGAQTQTQRYAG
jgi:hypothetical protein